MPFVPHDNVESPESSQGIMRYFSTSKFLSLLKEEALHWSRLDKFDDPLEGYAPSQNMQLQVRKIKELKEKQGILGSIDPEQFVLRMREASRRGFLCNCWSAGEKDSLAMWKSYIPSGDGVAISTDVGTLKDCIDSKNEFPYYVGAVRYTRHTDNFQLMYDDIDEVMTKPPQYEYENEIRLVKRGANSTSTMDPNEFMRMNISNETSPEFKVSVDLDSLIGEIYVSPFGPPWLTIELVENILDKYGVDADVVESELAKEPSDILEE